MDCSGTMRSTAVLAKTARTPISASGPCLSTSARSTSVAPRAFSHAMTASGPAEIGRARMPAAIAGATNLRMLGPTAVVTTDAAAISATRPSASAFESIARNPVTVFSTPPAPASMTRYEDADRSIPMRVALTSANTTS